MEKYYIDEIKSIESILSKKTLFIQGKRSIGYTLDQMNKDYHSEAIIVKNKGRY